MWQSRYVEHPVGQQRPNEDRDAPDAIKLSSLKWNIRRDRCGTMHTSCAGKQSLNWTCEGTSIQCSLAGISLVTWLCQGSPRTSRAALAALVTPGIDRVGPSEQSDPEKSVPIIKSRYDHCTEQERVDVQWSSNQSKLSNLDLGWCSWHLKLQKVSLWINFSVQKWNLIQLWDTRR